MPEPIVIPEQKNYEYAYGLAYKLAAEKFSGAADMEAQCRRSGALCQLSTPHPSITLKYLNREYRLDLPAVDISSVENSDKVELRDKILILHYLIQAKGTPPTGHWITYEELKEGANYFPSFYKRAVKPLIDYFGPSPDKIYETSGPLGGTKTDLGDFSVIIPAFPRVPLALVLWKGDEEFPPNANILFDGNILDYQPVEDVNILCQTIVWQMVKSLREIQSKP